MYRLEFQTVEKNILATFYIPKSVKHFKGLSLNENRKCI